jgi:hypothetical protein
MVQLFLHNVQVTQVGVVLKMSNMCCSNVQHTSNYVQNTQGVFGSAMPDGTPQSEQLPK